MTPPLQPRSDVVLAPASDFWWVIAPLDTQEHGPSIAAWDVKLLADRFLREELLPPIDDLHAAAVYDPSRHALIICLCDVTAVKHHRAKQASHFGPDAIPCDEPLEDADLHLRLNLLQGPFEPLSRGVRRRSVVRAAWCLAIALVGGVIVLTEAKRSVLTAALAEAHSQRDFAFALGKAATLESLSHRQETWRQRIALAAEQQRTSHEHALSLLASLAPQDAQQPGLLQAWSIRPGQVSMTLASDSPSQLDRAFEHLSARAPWRIEQHTREVAAQQQRLHITLRTAPQASSMQLAQREAP